jgi:hypothetical protein
MILGFGQTVSAQMIEPYKTDKEWPLAYEGRKLNYGALKRILLTEPSSAAAARKTNLPRLVATVVAAGGGYFVGQQAAILAVRQSRVVPDFKPLVLIGGLAAVGGSFIIEVNNKRKLKDAALLFNETRSSGDSSGISFQLEIGWTENGGGLVFIF